MKFVRQDFFHNRILDLLHIQFYKEDLSSDDSMTMMEDLDEEQQDVEEERNFIGGGIDDDVDHEMMESMFDFSAYVSEGNDDDDESDESSSGPLPGHAATSQQGWTYLTGNKTPDVSISIDGVDHRLLEKAREEVPIVLGNIKRKIFGSNRNRDMSKASPGDFLNAFMDPHLLGYMKTFINSSMVNDPVSSSDIIAFIRVELMLSFYKVRTTIKGGRQYSFLHSSLLFLLFHSRCHLGCTSTQQT